MIQNDQTIHLNMIKVTEIIANQLSVPVEKVKGDTNIAEELGADSLDIVELIMAFEDEHYGVALLDAERFEVVRGLRGIFLHVTESETFFFLLV